MSLAKKESRSQIINPEIFRAYDVRGIYPSQLNEEAAYRIGRALVLFFKTRLKNLSNARPLVVVGRDCRLSSPKIRKFFIRGLMKQGASIIDIGLVSTDTLYFALNFLKADAAAMITASHNPPNYNGIKQLVRGPKYICGDWGLPEIKKLVLENKFELIAKRGKIVKKNIILDYLKHIINIYRGLTKYADLRKIKAVVDAGNGMAGEIIKRLAKKLSLNLSCLYCQPDGRFPNHGPNPLIPENIKDLRKTVIKKKADFGLAFDSDGDRTIFIDEKGEQISGDLIIALFAKHFLRGRALKRVRPSIVYSLTCSKSVPEIIQENGGQPIRARTGHSFMKEVAKKYQAIFGGEISGHLYFQDNFYAECGGLTLLLMLKILSENEEPLSFLIKKIKRYYRVGEINLEIKDRAGAIKKLAKKYQNGQIDYLDGLTVKFKNWWFNARPSNTEPFLRIVIEADFMTLVQKRKKEILDLLT